MRERLQAGDSDDAVRAFLVARYGDFVLLKPPFELATFLLWTMPFGLVLLGGAALVLRRRSPSAEAEPAALSAEEQARVDALINEPGP